MKEQENHSRERESQAIEKMFSSSERVYEFGSRDDIKVPFRKVIQENTKGEEGKHENPPIFVYDTSGPFGDKKLGTHFRNRVDVHKGIQSTRGKWIREREDTRELNAPSSEFGRKKIEGGDGNSIFSNKPLQRKAVVGKNVTQLHYARLGIVTPEMEYVAIRENLKRN